MFGLFFINTFANLIALIYSSHNLNVVYLASIGVNATALPQTAQRIALLVSHNLILVIIILSPSFQYCLIHTS